MNRIVRKHYPVKKLPEDLRPNLSLLGTVTITVQEEDAAQATPSVTEMIKQMQDARARMPIAKDDPVKRIRRLRDEWED
jgi:hypothetical protein